MITSTFSKSLATDFLSTRNAVYARWLLVTALVLSAASCIANLSLVNDFSDDEVVELALHSAAVPILIASLVAGIYTTSAERRYGVIDQRILSNPSRMQWLSSKLTVQGLVGIVYGTLGAVVTIVASKFVFGLNDANFEVYSETVVLSLIGLVFGAICFSTIGAALGSISGNTPAIISASLIWSFIIETPIIIGLPAVGKWLPTASALGVTRTPDPNLLEQTAAAIGLTAWTVVFVVAAKQKLRHTDT